MLLKVLLQSVLLAGYFILVARESIARGDPGSKATLWLLTQGFPIESCLLQVLNLISRKSVHLPHRDPTLGPKRCVDALVQLFAQIICH